MIKNILIVILMLASGLTINWHYPDGEVSLDLYSFGTVVFAILSIVFLWKAIHLISGRKIDAVDDKKYTYLWVAGIVATGIGYSWRSSTRVAKTYEDILPQPSMEILYGSTNDFVEWRIGMLILCLLSYKLLNVMKASRQV